MEVLRLWWRNVHGTARMLLGCRAISTRKMVPLFRASCGVCVCFGFGFLGMWSILAFSTHGMSSKHGGQSCSNLSLFHLLDFIFYFGDGVLSKLLSRVFAALMLAIGASCCFDNFLVVLSLANDLSRMFCSWCLRRLSWYCASHDEGIQPKNDTYLCARRVRTVPVKCKEITKRSFDPPSFLVRNCCTRPKGMLQQVKWK